MLNITFNIFGIVKDKIILAVSMIPVLLASHYAYADTLIGSNAKKLNTIVLEMDSKITAFDSAPRMQKGDTVAAIKQYKDSIMKIKKQFQMLNPEKNSTSFLPVTTLKKAVRAADQAADNAYCLVVNKYLNQQAYTDCVEKFAINKNKALRLTARLS